VNAELTDDDLGDPGGRAPGQRSVARRSDRVASRRSADPAGAELPDTPSSELPVVPAAAPTTTLPTTTGSAPASAPGGGQGVTHPVESPTAELRGAPVRGDQSRPADGRSVPGPLPTNIYRSRRPGVAILLVIPAVAVGLLLVRAVAIAAFGDTFDIGGIVASICGLASLPFLVAGLYGLVTGAAHGAEHYGFRIWARPPLAYLIVGLSFVLAAGLAIR
jgi:hypothetical protein